MIPIVPQIQDPILHVDNAFDLSTWSIPTTEADATLPLKDRLNNAMVHGDGGRYFIPEDTLSTILSPQNITTELRCQFPLMPTHDMRQLVTQITARNLKRHGRQIGLLRIFAILILLEKANKINDFVSEGLSDHTLPLLKVKTPGVAPSDPTFHLQRRDMSGVPLRCFNGWSQSEIGIFERLQWRLCSPVFWEISETQEGDFLDLQEQTVLPYIETWQNKKEDHYKGGNSEVWKVKIHDAHHNFQNVNGLLPNNPYFAIKRLKSKDDEAFRREVRNLLRLHNAEHPNLLSLLATYKYKGYYHLVFPWADGDLRRLWQSTPNPQAGKEEMRWLASQCASIASALRSVHAGAESWMHSTGDGPSDKQRMAMNKFGLHGDIKPENIFIFSKGHQKKALAMGLPHLSEETSSSSSDSDRSSQSSSPTSVADEYVMSIGDFGGGEFFDPSSNPDPLKQITVAYRPPEYDTKLRPVSRSWDVWGLGCTYLEFVTWFLLGPNGLKEFAKRRTTRTAAGKLSDEYFDTFVDETQTGGIRATLKESVLTWINDLYHHKNASQFIREFLDYITHHMFIVENEFVTRASGAEVADYLNKLTRKCLDSDVYCLPETAIKTAANIANNAFINDNDLDILSTTQLDGFANSGIDLGACDFTASGDGWDFPTLSDIAALGQWNTAPIHQVSGFHASLNCADLLNSWNYTAPVAWNQSSMDVGPNTSIDRKRKRSVEDVTDEPLKRVSHKTSSASPKEQSPQTSDASTMESPILDSNGANTEKRFACPYYKNNPGKFRQKRTCCGPGWPTVHRVKEHLYRCHTIGKHTCSRCMKRCKSAAELLAHQRADVPCETRSDAFPEGTMMPSQEEVLRVKKRVPPNTTEEQRWNEVYMVLFPDATPESLPTPFYEDDAAEPRPTADSLSSKLNNDSPDGISWSCSPSDYEQYLSRSLPPRVQRELERQVQQDFGFFGDDAQTKRMVDIAQKLQLRMFKAFQKEVHESGARSEVDDSN
ncbi:hypothetical protein BD289DRAFT_425290 [Coniella lustricola]|uniref:Protein kinase domain-containing protein n=1 Tax=Coniella lustricola TaxID=2025994 RepID=A0A2T3AH61_9PEZI|nr:hypothetical protein BD289DRAFT_425290 [Coniella lustricola]